MENIIKDFCFKNIKMFSNMNDMEIYDWICENFWCKDYQMMRRISLEICKRKIEMQ